MCSDPKENRAHETAQRASQPLDFVGLHHHALTEQIPRKVLVLRTVTASVPRLRGARAPQPNGGYQVGAVVSLNHLMTFEDGSTWVPEMEFLGQTKEREPIIDSEATFRKFHGETVFESLQKLRSDIAGILEKHGITVLPEGEWRKAVPWLWGGDEVFVGLFR